MKIHLEFEMFDASANITPPKHPGDSGCDLGVPETVRFAPGETKFVGHRVRARMMFEDDSAHRRRVGFCLYPRSSISKTPLRLANSVGVIDAG
jgi:dUTP pyrophosphatase